MKLVFRSGPRSDEELEIDREMVLGREGADIEIEDSAVSRKHAILRPAGDDVEIEDLESTNGTYVNGTKIDSPTTLQPGDFVNIGQSTLEVGGVDWRSAETQAISIPGAGPGDAEEQDEYVPTSPIAIEGEGSRSPLSAIPKVWLFAGAALILIILLIVAITSLTGGGPTRGEVLKEADAICRKAQKSVGKVELSASQKLAALKGDAGRLAAARGEVLSKLRKDAFLEPTPVTFRSFLDKYSATNDRLRFVEGLGARTKKGPLRRAVDAARGAAREDAKAANAAGLRVCGGLPV